MGSVGFGGEVESQPSTSNCKKYKLPRTLLVGCGAVNHASVPKKLRSAIKKRGRETAVASPLSNSRKQHHVSNGVETLKKDGAKKSKLKRGQITKDEEEVAETLYALASMFSDTNKANQPGSDDEPLETKSYAIPEAGSSMNAVEDSGIPTLREESTKISSKVTLEASSKQSSPPSGSVVESDFGVGPRPRESTFDTTPSGEHAIDLEKVTVFGVQYSKKDYPMDNKYNGLHPSPSLSASETHGSCLRLPARFESTNIACQPPVIENSITTEKYTRVPVESKKTWKRSSAHVYISRLIKVLQISEGKEGSPEKPTQLTTSVDARQMTGINGRNGGLSFNGIDPAAEKDSSAEIQNDILLHKGPIQDQPLVSETSALCSGKEGYNFLSLGMEVCGLDASRGINRERHSDEARKQFHSSYMQSQNHSAVLFSLPHNGYSSTFHGHNSALASQQVQLPQYLSSTANSSFSSRTGRQLDLQQQKWAAQLSTQYNNGGVGSPNLPDWKNGKMDSPSSVLNYTQAIFPHLLGSKYQQFSPQQQQLMSINSSLHLPNVKLHHHHQFPLGFERNRATFYSENIPQLQLPCDQHL